MRPYCKKLLSMARAISLAIFSLLPFGCGDGLNILFEDGKIITRISGEITSDTTLSHNTEVTGDVIVSGGTLTIKPGTKIEVAAENDNAVYGTSDHVAIIVLNGGALQANGTEDDPILFTSASETPAGGDWDRIRFIANGTMSSITYCIIEYSFNGICIENPAGVTGSSTPVIDHVTVRHATGAGMYATDASQVEITSSTIYDCNSGIFFHGAANTAITNALIYDVSAGIILAGDAAKSSMNVSINHITIYNVDPSLTSSPTWWTGYGIYTCNDASVLTLNNSIISNPAYYGLYCGAAWTINENYNCFFGGTGAKENGGAIGAASMEQNPGFKNAEAHNFTLGASSPCINAASDGSDMGVN